MTKLELLEWQHESVKQAYRQIVEELCPLYAHRCESEDCAHNWGQMYLHDCGLNKNVTQVC